MPREKMVQVGFRFPETLVTRIDALAEQASRAHPGRTVSRADLVRGFLIEAVDLAEARERGEGKSPKGRRVS